MTTPTSKAIMGPRFLGTVTALAEDAAWNANAALGAGQRRWQRPPLEGWSGAPADVAGLVQAFDRGAENAAYSAAVLDPASPGTVGDLVAMKAQIDYVGAMERAYRSRLASPVRCRAHASSRRLGHGAAGGPLLGGAVGYVQDVVTAAGASS